MEWLTHRSSVSHRGSYASSGNLTMLAGLDGADEFELQLNGAESALDLGNQLGVSRIGPDLWS